MCHRQQITAVKVCPLHVNQIVRESSNKTARYLLIYFCFSVFSQTREYRRNLSSWSV